MPITRTIFRPFILAALMLTSFAAAAKADNILILRAELLHGNKPIQSIEVYANDIDPNKWSVDDKFALKIDGRKARVSRDLLASIAQNRRSYSYDSQSGGISSKKPKALCSLGGPARGWILSSRYLTYSQHKITGDEMRPVFSRAGNCLFAHDISPKNQHAKLAASEALAQLVTIYELKK